MNISQTAQEPLSYATRQARGLATQVLNKVAAFFFTDDAKQQLQQFPSSTNPKKLVKRQIYLQELLKSITEEKTTILKKYAHQALSLESSGAKQLNTITIACEDLTIYKKIKEEVAGSIQVSIVERDQDLFSLSSYEQVRLIPADESRLSPEIETIDNVLIFSPQAGVDEVFPERYLRILESQQDAYAALLNLREVIQVDIPKIVFAPQEKLSPEQVQVTLESHQKSIEQKIEQATQQEQFAGEIFTKILRGEKKLLDALSPATKDAILQHIHELEQEREELYGHSFSQSLEIDATGKTSIDSVIFEKEYAQAVYAKTEREREGVQGQAKSAKQIITQLDAIKKKIIEADFNQGLVNFHKHYDLSFPEFINQGCEFVYGKNLNLENAVPVSYCIGRNDTSAVLTGANSGGKTTLMELLAQIQILAQLGLGVPAKEVKIACVQELHYFSKSKGTLGAGAFETMLAQFARLSTKADTAKLILADEIESVTEPDVAARIIKGIVHELNTHKQTTVLLVSHVGKELQKLGCPARFDGIEAKGLAEDFALVVDRNPVIGKIARSTPQLIVERLAKTKNEKFYQQLLEHITG